MNQNKQMEQLPKITRIEDVINAWKSFQEIKEKNNISTKKIISTLKDKLKNEESKKNELTKTYIDKEGNAKDINVYEYNENVRLFEMVVRHIEQEVSSGQIICNKIQEYGANTLTFVEKELNVEFGQELYWTMSLRLVEVEEALATGLVNVKLQETETAMLKEEENRKNKVDKTKKEFDKKNGFTNNTSVEEIKVNIEKIYDKENKEKISNIK